jgi:ribosome-associated protein
MVDEPEADDGYDGYDGPSKSARKRAAHDAQRLGVQLVELRDTELIALGLPERLLDALQEMRRITSRTAAVRQRQYIGKIMRALDLTEIEAALEERDRRRALETQRQKLIERWRTRLIQEGSPALQEFVTGHPPAVASRMAELVTAARAEDGPESARITAMRELFRALRELVGRV